jgi:cobalt-zinc-cadmium efflux system protein
MGETKHSPHDKAGTAPAGGPQQDHLDSHSHNHSHNHSHEHSHDHVLDLDRVNFSFVVAVAANLAFTLLEAFYGFLSDSVSLLGDAGHNLSDVLGLLLAWGAAYLSGRKASQLYSYGFRRTTILAAIINAMVLVFVAGYIGWESFQKFFQPSPMDEVTVMVVASIGILVNAGTAMLFMRGSREDLNQRGAFLHLAYDALISAGVVIAAVIVLYTGWQWVDPVMGLVIVVVILAGTWGLLRDSVNLILDAVPQGIELDEVRQYLASIDGVTEVHDLHVWALSTRETSLTAHLVMPQNSLWDSADTYASISDHLRQHFSIHHVTLQVEKDQDCSNTGCD